MVLPAAGVALGSLFGGGTSAAMAAATAAGAAKIGQAAYGALAGGPSNMTGYADPRDPFYQKADEHGQRKAGFDEDPLMYGGSAAASAAEIERARSRAAGWDAQGMHYADGRDQQAARDASLAARQEQMYGQQAALARAEGRGPSVAGERFSAGQQQAALDQAAAMAAGPTAMAQQAGQGAMGAMAATRGAGVAGETAAGRQAFMQGAGAMRQGDTGMAQSDASWESARAQAFNKQRALQDEQVMFFEKQRHGVNRGNMGAVDAVNRANLQEYGRNLQNARKDDEDSKQRTASTVGKIGTLAQAYSNFAAPRPPT